MGGWVLGRPLLLEMQVAFKPLGKSIQHRKPTESASATTAAVADAAGVAAAAAGVVAAAAAAAVALKATHWPWRARKAS